MKVNSNINKEIGGCGSIVEHEIPALKVTGASPVSLDFYFHLIREIFKIKVKIYIQKYQRILFLISSNFLRTSEGVRSNSSDKYFYF